MALETIDNESWDEFWRYWEDLIEEWPHAKAEALFAAGKAVLPLLQEQISQRVDDRRGRVRRWQEIRRGSRGGYVAVSPAADQVSVNKTKNRFVTSKDITRYLERGHGIRQPSGKSKRYVPKIQSGRVYVPGRMFYSWTKMDAEKAALEAAELALAQLDEDINNYFY